MASVIDILRMARSLVSQGWTQGRYVSDDGSLREGASCYCASGAVRRAGFVLDATAREQIWACEAVVRACEIQQVGYREYESSLICWNDEEGRTQQEVVAAFDLAISKVMAGEV